MHNNHVLELEQEDPDLDCCFMTILGWGRTKSQQKNRKSLKEPNDDVLKNKLAAPKDFHIRQSKEFWNSRIGTSGWEKTMPTGTFPFL